MRKGGRTREKGRENVVDIEKRATQTSLKKRFSD